MNRVARNPMRGSAKAAAMLDLWASVKRARDEAPRDRDGDLDREESSHRVGAPPAMAPAE